MIEVTSERQAGFFTKLIALCQEYNVEIRADRDARDRSCISFDFRYNADFHDLAHFSSITTTFVDSSTDIER